MANLLDNESDDEQEKMHKTLNCESETKIGNLFDCQNIKIKKKLFFIGYVEGNNLRLET